MADSNKRTTEKRSSSPPNKKTRRKVSSQPNPPQAAAQPPTDEPAQQPDFFAADSPINSPSTSQPLTQPPFVKLTLSPLIGQLPPTISVGHLLPPPSIGQVLLQTDEHAQQPDFLAADLPINSPSTSQLLTQPPFIKLTLSPQSIGQLAPTISVGHLSPPSIVQLPQPNLLLPSPLIGQLFPPPSIGQLPAPPDLLQSLQQNQIAHQQLIHRNELLGRKIISSRREMIDAQWATQWRRDQAVLEQIRSFADSIIYHITAAVQPGSRSVNYPNLEPRLRPLTVLPPQKPNPDPQHLALDLLQSTPNSPVQIDLSQYLPNTKSPTKSDEQLVLLPAFDLSFRNRWQHTTEVIDYSTIRFTDWQDCWHANRRLALTEQERLRLKRFKIYALPKLQMTNLLNNLHLLPSLEHLEFMRLTISATQTTELTFSSLRLLSINCIQVVNPDRERMAEGKLLKISSDKLKCLFLGLDSIDCIEFNSPQITHLNTDKLPPESELKQTFQSLELLECNQVEKANLDLVKRIACGDLLPQLQTLFCNLGSLISASDPPDKWRLKKFELLFEMLKAVQAKPNLEFFLNHVHLNPIKQHPQLLQFNDFQFDQPLVVSHYHNFVFNRLSLFYCKTVQDVNYLDVCSTFWLLEPKTNDQLEESRVFGFYKLIDLFPNIQRIIFRHPSTNSSSKPDGPLFVSFLNECQALSALELYSAEFGWTDFYQYLYMAHGLRTLDSLTIFEQPGEFSEQLDFSFLALFGYLRKFHTNLVTITAAVDLIGQMRIRDEFKFQFYPKPMGQNFNQANIQKREDLRYEVSLQQGNICDATLDQTVLKVVCDDLEAVKDLFFEKINSLLDDVPISKA